MYDNYKETDVWKNMQPEKQEIIGELVKNTKGKSMKESAPAVMLAISRMRKENLKFTKEESDCMINVMAKDMTPAEKAQLEFIKSQF